MGSNETIFRSSCDVISFLMNEDINKNKGGNGMKVVRGQDVAAEVVKAAAAGSHQPTAAGREALQHRGRHS